MDDDSDGRGLAGGSVPAAAIASTFAARVAGLPVSVLEGLSAPEVGRAVDEVVDLETSLRDEADTLSDRLYEVVGAADGDLRGRLVGLRRALHNVRAPAAAEWDDEVRAHLPGELRADIFNWLATLRRRQRAAEQLAAAHASASAAADDALAAAIDDPVFAAALRHANPQLLRQARRSGLGGAQRRARLARYVGRTAAKTSPRQWFGSWAAARLDDDDLQWRGALHRVAIVEPSLEVVRRWIAQAADEAAHTAIAGVLRPVPGLWHDEDSWRFALPNGETVRLRRTPAVDAALELSSTAVSAAELVRSLAERTGDAEASRRFVAELRRVGALEQRFEGDSDDPLDCLLDGWGAMPSAGDRVADGLARWRSAVGAAPRDPAAEDGATEGLLDEFKSAPDDAPAWCDTVVTGAELAVPRTPLRRASEALGALQRMTGLFDYAIKGRRELLEMLEEAFPGVDDVPLMEAYEAAITRREERLRREAAGQRGEAAGQRGEEPTHVDAAGVERLHDALLAPALLPTEESEVDLGPAEVAELFDRAPGYVELPACLAIHTQLDPGEPEVLVVNDIARGRRAPARVARLLARAGQPVPPGMVANPDGGDAIALDVIAPFDSNLNLRAPGTGPVLMVPGNGLSPPGSREAVDPAWLVIRRRRGRAELWWPQRGARVRPHPTGMMSELWMPPFMLFVMGCFGASPRKPPILQRWAQHCADRPAEVAALPRVLIDRRVAIERRTHAIDLESFPLPGGAVTEADLLAVERFRRHHALPRRGFVRVVDLARFGRQSTVPDKARKPLFIDLASPTWLDLVARLARSDRATHILLQEALPDPRRQPADGSGQRRVTEFLLELSSGQAHASGQAG